MKLKYYPDTDSLYIDLSEKPSVSSQEISEGVVIDFDSTLTPKNQNLPIFGHFSPVISDVPTTFFPISSTRGGTAIPAALNPK